VQDLETSSTWHAGGVLLASARAAFRVRVWEIMFTDAVRSIHNHLRLLKKLAPWRHWVSGEAVTRVRLIAGCVRLDFFVALSLLRSSSAVASVARGR